MPVSFQTLKKLGVTQAALKKLFTANSPDPKIETLVNGIRDRMHEGYDCCMRGWHTIYLIKQTYDTPFFQKSRALLQGLLGGKTQSKDVLGMIKDFGIDNIGWDCTCGTRNCASATCLGTKTYQSQLLIEVLVPLVLAYVNARWGKIFNDRNLFPQFKFTPLINTAELRLLCEILNYRVQVQSQQMNYVAILRQVILQALQYADCVIFPKEAWWTDEQPQLDGDKIKMKVDREGIRYDHPTPDRCYIDPAFPRYTLNSDTGARFGGYWCAVPYGDVMDNPDYWNTKKITFGENSFRITDANVNYWRMLYPCTVEFPSLPNWGPDTDRESRFVKYATTDRDKAVILTNHFQLVNPKRDLGLTNKSGQGYDALVWMRFVMAGDDTVVYCEPTGYPPMRYFGCDADANRAVNASMVLKIAPFEEAVHNALNQALLTAKNNLTKVVLLNTDCFDDSIIKTLSNMGENRYRTPNIAPYSKFKNKALNIDAEKAFHEIAFSPQSVSEQIGIVATLLDILNRVLGMSPQELGASASHELSAAEVKVTAANVSTQLRFTESFIDDGIDAWGKQLVMAGVEHWDDEIFAEIALENDADKDVLEKLGFKVELKSDRMAGVRGSKRLLNIDAYTGRRDGPDRANEVALSAAMLQFFDRLISNPPLLQAVGVKQVVDTWNLIARVGGLPRDYKLTVVNDPLKNQDQQAQDVQKQFAEILPKAMQQVKADTLKEVGDGLKPLIDAVKQLKDAAPIQEQAIGAVNQKVDQVTQLAMETKQALEAIIKAASQQPPMAPPAPPMMPTVAGAMIG